MELVDILTPAGIAIEAGVKSKKGVLESLAGLISAQATGIQSKDVLASLAARERLGSTSLGHGVAIPHGRLENVDRVLGAFLMVPGGIGFDAVDRQPVDLFFALLVPSDCCDDHLQLLAKLAEVFSDAAALARIRQCESAQEIFEQMLAWQSAA